MRCTGARRTQSYSGQADWEVIARVARAVSIPVYGNGDCIEPGDTVRRMKESGVAGVLVGRGALRNPWIFAQAAALAAGQPPVEVSLADRGRFLLEYIDMLLGPKPRAFGPEPVALSPEPSPGHPRWVVNKLRALCAWYTRGLDGGAHLREAVNHAPSIPALRETIAAFFFGPGLTRRVRLTSNGPD